MATADSLSDLFDETPAQGLGACDSSDPGARGPREKVETATAPMAASSRGGLGGGNTPMLRTGGDAADRADRGRAAYTALEAMNWSTLKHMARSPKMFRYRLEHPEEAKPAFDFGRAFHCALLEPAAFGERFVVEPDFGNLRTKAAREERDGWRAANAQRTPIAQEDMDTIVAMANAVREHKVARELLEGARAEQTIAWTDAGTGVRCKARLDMLGRAFVADVKTSRDPEPRAFARDAAQHLYHGQLAMYHDGAIAAGLIPKDADPPYVIVPEKEEPYDVVVFRLHLNLALTPGRALYRALLRRFLECEAAGWWPGISPELQLLELPPWAPGNEAGPTSEFELGDDS